MTRSFWATPVLAVGAGLVLLLAGAAGWVDAVDVRDVGGVQVREPLSTSGTVYAPTAVVFGLAGLLGGVLTAVVRGRGRRSAALLLALVGIAATAVVVAGLVAAAAADGSLTPAPAFALIAALGLVVAGVFGARGPARPPAASKYRVEGEQPSDDEWHLAADDDES